MVCNTCGRHQQNEDANFCEYCGASFRGDNGHDIEPVNNYNSQYGTGNTSTPTQPPMPEAINVNQKEKTVSMLEWLGTYLIMFIPLVGGIVFFIMLLIWSFSNTIPTSKKNWARATLIFYVIMIIIFIVLLAFYIPMLDSSMFNNMLNIETKELTNILREYR